MSLACPASRASMTISIMSGLISSDAKILGQITYDDPGMVTFPIRSWTF